MFFRSLYTRTRLNIATHDNPTIEKVPMKRNLKPARKRKRTTEDEDPDGHSTDAVQDKERPNEIDIGNGQVDVINNKNNDDNIDINVNVDSRCASASASTSAPSSICRSSHKDQDKGEIKKPKLNSGWGNWDRIFDAWYCQKNLKTYKINCLHSHCLKQKK